jgi:hypothetical protein
MSCFCKAGYLAIIMVKCRTVIPAEGEAEVEGHMLEASMGYKIRPCLKDK